MLAQAFCREVRDSGNEIILGEHLTAKVKRIAEIMTSLGRINGIALIGGCGCGKTTMLMAFWEVWTTLYHRGAFDKLRTEWFKPRMKVINARKLLEAARNPQLFNELKNYALLGIDDLGTEPVEVMDYGNIVSPLAELIEARYENRLFTMITTNMAPCDVRRRYGDRVADRFNEMFHRVAFDNSTYRHSPEIVWP